MPTANITEHFSYNEFACKDGTPYPSRWINDRLLALCEELESIRSYVNRGPIIILSGYRTLTYNKAIGGARLSQHVDGRAADICIEHMLASELHARILAFIDSHDTTIRGIGCYPNFVHVDIRPTSRLARWYGGRLIS